ncbi:MAG: hypothetical protein J7518_23025 [Nocardioidaceae bacterium]|nr:hypothetical protein [Nocardioidaceae bacterium]
MRPRLRTALAAVAAAVLVPALTITAADAAAPGNDTAAGATDVGSLPASFDQDTTQATTDALDASLNNDCGAPFTNASVWFKYTETTGDGFIASMTDSDYSGGFIVTEGDPADGNLVACGPGAVGVATSPGTTYYVVAFSDTATNGGHLHVTFDTAPPPPELTITADSRAVAYKDGSARVSGTYSCSNANEGDAEIDGTLTQRVGRTKITGDFFVYPLECDGQTHTWTADVFSSNGLFRGGKAGSVTFGYACGLLTCADGYSEQTVQLSSGSGHGKK